MCRAIFALLRHRGTFPMGRDDTMGRILVQYFFQTSDGMTPFQALYCEPPTVARYILGSAASELVESYLLQRDEVLHILKHNLLKAQNRMKLFADKSRTDTSFEVGDWVYVKLKPF